MEYHFYSFVAHHYLSPLQQGLQTAHAVALLSYAVHSHAVGQLSFATNRPNREQFAQWSGFDKTIIICGASNHAGVVHAYEQFKIFTDTGLLGYMQPVIFFEDEQSMNKMATACGVLVPSRYYDAWFSPELGRWVSPENEPPLTDFENDFVTYLKSFRLA